MTKVLENIWREMPNNITFTADTLEKAIVKLHRLNACQHNSIDDWHLNMIEATKDLEDPEAQEEFIKYLSNPAGYEHKDTLWDHLEEYDKKTTSKVVQKLAQHDEEPDWDNLYLEGAIVGNTQYIHIKREPEDEKEDDEKVNIPDLD